MNPIFGFFLAAGATLYGTVLKGIHYAYQKGILKTHRLNVPVVSVGNLTWGGTGKTPIVMQLAKGFEKQGKHVAVLTRGYGRDEAKLLTQRLNPIPVLVNPDRVAAGERAVKEHGADLLLLDDGYQQWRLKKDVEILLLNAAAPFGPNGKLIPQGILREPKEALKRAHLIVLTKAERNLDGLEDLERQIRGWTEAPIFRATTRPISLTHWPSGKSSPTKELKGERVATLAGIAEPQQFEATVESLGASIGLKFRFRDHRPYTAGELIRVISRCQRHGIQTLVTTAKDAIRFPRLLTESLGSDLRGMDIVVLEILLEFEPDESKLLHRIDSLLAG